MTLITARNAARSLTLSGSPAQHGPDTSPAARPAWCRRRAGIAPSHSPGASAAPSPLPPAAPASSGVANKPCALSPPPQYTMQHFLAKRKAEMRGWGGGARQENRRPCEERPRGSAKKLRRGSSGRGGGGAQRTHFGPLASLACQIVCKSSHVKQSPKQDLASNGRKPPVSHVTVTRPKGEEDECEDEEEQKDNDGGK